MFDIDRYFQRIGFERIDEEDREAMLIRLHCCHSFTIPFEDFDPFCRVPVSLDLEHIFNKVILEKRGGYCFELNLLFQTLLHELGYQTEAIFCRPFSGEGAKLPLTHRMTMVPLEDKLWITDVGLGGNGWIAPLVFQVGKEQEQFGRIFRIVEDSRLGYIVERKVDNQFKKAVAFHPEAAEESDFVMSNYYTSACPTSPFVNRMMCTLPTQDGRYTIRDTTFRIEDKNGVREIALRKDNLQNILKQYFGIILTDEMNQFICKHIS